LQDKAKRARQIKEIEIASLQLNKETNMFANTFHSTIIRSGMPAGGGDGNPGGIYQSRMPAGGGDGNPGGIYQSRMPAGGGDGNPGG
jgi:hypothetical protein